MSFPRSSLLALALFLPVGLAPAPATAASSPLDEIRLFPGSQSIFVNGGFAFGAIGIYEDGTTKDLSGKVRFTTSNESVAEFERKNILAAKAPGTVQVGASYKGIEATPITFNVSPVGALSIIREENGVRLGSAVRWGAEATLLNGAGGLAFSPFVVWSTGNENVLSVDNRRNTRGISRGLALGTSTLTATFDRPDPGVDVMVSRLITVVDDLASIAVTPAVRVLQPGGGGSFRAIGTFEGGVLADITLDVEFISSNPDVLSVNKRGVLRVRGFGQTTLRVVDRETGVDSNTSGVNATVTIVGEVESLTVKPAAIELLLGESEGFDAIAEVEENASTFSWGGRVVWTSSNDAVASVDGDGDVLCRTPGTAIISALDRRSGVRSTDTDADGQITCTEP